MVSIELRDHDGTPLRGMGLSRVLSDVISRAVSDPSSGPLVARVHPYEETEFRAGDCERLIKKIDALAQGHNSVEREALQQLRRLSVRCMERGGTLVFIGD